MTSGCYQDCAALPSDQARERAEERGDQFTVRLRQLPGRQKRVYPDLIYGKIVPLKRSSASLAATDDETGIDAADTILIKSDGTPTYHFANVVDDHLMQITHVIRGTEWMASTPLHYDLYHAFGWEPPAFAHVGLLVDEKKAKLSKRNADLALDVSSMRGDHGVLPETLCNFLALLGWSNPLESDIYDMEELAKSFDLKFTKGNTMVRTEKLWYLQKHHVARRCQAARDTNSVEPIRILVDQIGQEAEQRHPEFQGRFSSADHRSRYCTDVLLVDDKSFQNARQYVERNRYFFSFDAGQVPPERDFYDKHGRISPHDVQMCVEHLMASDSLSRGVWRDLSHTSSLKQEQISATAVRIHDAIDGLLAKASTTEGEAPLDSKVWNAALMRYLREKLSYGLPGPSVGVVMAILGYRECCRRLGVDADAKADAP